jgi:protein-L-isoaspartate(D-aspartate) O-methyltransferase
MRKMKKDYTRKQREEIVNLIRHRGVRDERVLQAMLKVPRHRFVPLYQREMAYEDAPLSIGSGQTISQPYIVALMTEALMLEGNEKVLEIGTGSGYQTAILSLLCRWVYTVERLPELSQRAQEVLSSLGYHNISFKVGDGTLGWKEHAPYQAIMVTAGAPKVPSSLIEQLDVGGRLVIPVGSPSHQELLRITKEDDKGNLRRESLGGCIFVRLIGAEGWN